MDFYSFFITNLDFSLLLIFGIIFGIILILNKKRLEIQKIVFPLLYLILYKTKWGLKAMDSFAKKLSERAKNILSYSAITTGFIGMAFILVTFLQSVYKYFFIEKEMIVAPLLPGVTIPGLPKLTFIHWIIAIFVLATVHEFSHGLFARMHKIKVKSSGFAFFGILLPIIPAAFVEPDEKQLQKASKKKQLAVLSAGTFANFITALVFFLILMFIFTPLTALTLSGQQGITIAGIDTGGPSDNLGIEAGEKILALNNIEISNLKEFFDTLNKTVPFEKAELKTNKAIYYMTLGENPQAERGYIGLQLAPNLNFWAKLLVWLNILIYWIFLTNLMVGLINLLPIGIVDGGRMFYLVLLTVFKKEKIAKRTFNVVSIILLLMLLLFLIPALFNYFTAPFLG
jgi:membrane-associated protease RseP (regulator of RpoE activity)